MSTPTKFNTIDQYIASFPEQVQERLTQIRQTIQEVAPGATEAISYGMPTFKLDGKNLVHFAAYKNHIGFYPTPSGMTAFEEELSRYKSGKGSAQFPLDQPVPFQLIRDITTYRVQEVTGRQD